MALSMVSGHPQGYIHADALSCTVHKTGFQHVSLNFGERIAKAMNILKRLKIPSFMKLIKE